LRHFGNNYVHASLDRHLALALLRHLFHGERPTLQPDQQRLALAPLWEFLRLKGVHAQAGADRRGRVVPLVITRAGGDEIWVDLHHALTDPDGTDSEIRRLAESEMVEYCSLDSFTLIHDLPAAVAVLQL
jgi:hypothetical protein